MFSNLIESSSHRGEFRRRGSFFLFTTASYALLFVIAGVVSIYAYDARMENQNVELATIMPLIDIPVPAAEPPVSTPDRSPSSVRAPQDYYVRKSAMAAVDNPNVAPTDISTKPNPDLPMPTTGLVKFGSVDSNPTTPGNPGEGSGSNLTGRTSPPIVIAEPPPAAVPIPKPVPKVLRKAVINGDALVLPKPAYPAMAKEMHVQGRVNVQVLIDEKGRVISATPVSGHALLTHVAQQAAFQARFSPTFLGDQPVKVSGVITYNFVLQ